MSTNPLPPLLASDPNAGNDPKPAVLSPIQHVIYVIKENRTYDQEFGSLGKGNGDPSLNLFGQESAPNARALQSQFVTLDNFYADADVSADGWNWATGALANTYVQKAFPADYSNGDRNRPYDFEGGNLATSPGPNPQDAFIWDKLSDVGISYRNYGFRVFDGQVATTEPRLAANTDLNFAGFDLTKPDAFATLFGTSQPTRIDEWLKEFNQYVAANNLPTVEFVRLPSDHNAGTTPGAPTPRAYVADNDLALGKLVDAVSHSKYWGSTAIFVTEDDAQDGPDHVDAHRTISQVISPYTQTGKVDSTFYSTVSMLRTMEQIIGIPPMTQFDATASSMVKSFTDHANMKPYDAITPPLATLQQKNPAPNPLAGAPTAASLAAAGLGIEDQVNEQTMNQMVWESVKGDVPMPAPKHDVQLRAGPLADGTGVTPSGRLLTPAGQQTDLGDRPFGIALSPDGKTLLVSNDGASNIESLMVIDRTSGKVVQTIPYKAPEALYIGLTFSPDGKHAYASAGGNNKIRVYDVTGQHLTENASIVLPQPTDATGKLVNLFPAGLTISADGHTLYVADNLGDRLSVINLMTQKVTTIAVGHNPYTVALSGDNKTAYVSNWGDTTVSVVDVSQATPKVLNTLQVGTHPNAMTLDGRHGLLFVANADSDNVSVVDTKTNKVVRTIDLAPFPGARIGSSPNALALSADGQFLYVANAMDNDIAVVRLGTKKGAADKVEGLIPTAWLPAGVVLSPDDKKLYVINAKGLGAGPNLQGPNPYINPESADNQYVASMSVGTLSIIDVPSKSRLEKYTDQVFANNRFGPADGTTPQGENDRADTGINETALGENDVGDTGATDPDAGHARSRRRHEH